MPEGRAPNLEFQSCWLPYPSWRITDVHDSKPRCFWQSSELSPRNLRCGDEIGIDLSVDKFTEEKITEITLVTEDSGSDEVETVEIEEVEALPITGKHCHWVDYQWQYKQ